MVQETINLPKTPSCSELISECHKRNFLKILLTSLMIVLCSLANKPKYQNGNSYQPKTAQRPADDRWGIFAPSPAMVKTLVRLEPG